jgi:exopolyphosphatase/pppGpp-phosphohydrolase
MLLFVYILLLLNVSCGRAQLTPAKEAYVDLGSGNTKLILVTYQKDKPALIESKRTAILFKKNMMADKKFPSDIEKQGLATLLQYATEARAAGAVLKGGGATSAFRDADAQYVNQLLDGWSKASGWKLKVLSADEEAEAGYHAMTLLLPELKDSGFIGFDMGGGSCQLLRENEGKLAFYLANFGAVNCSRFAQKTFADKRPELAQSVAAFQQEFMAASELKAWQSKGNVPLVAIGGVVFGFSKLLELKDNMLAEERLRTLESELRTLSAVEIETKYPSTKPYGAEMWSNTVALLAWMDTLNIRAWKILQVEMGAGLGKLEFFK